MRCALVNLSNNIVENLIIADPAVDPSPPGFVIISLPEDSPVAIGWLYNPSTGEFTNPEPQNG